MNFCWLKNDNVLLKISWKFFLLLILNALYSGMCNFIKNRSNVLQKYLGTDYRNATYGLKILFITIKHVLISLNHI